MSHFDPSNTGTQPTPVARPPQSQWQAPQYPPPETSYPPVPLSPEPPRKRMRRNDKVALGFILALVSSGVLIAIIVFASAGTPQTVSLSQADQQATVTQQTAVAAGETAITNDQLTQAASVPTVEPTMPPVTFTPQNDAGTSQTSGAWSITINSVKTTAGGPYDAAPKAGDVYILINFTAHNNDIGAQDMSPVYFALRDDQGNTYDLAYITVPHDPRGTVVSGQNLRGDLSYEIPASLHTFTLQFDSPDDFDNSQVVQWNLSV